MLPKYLYHLTSRKHLPSIFTEGLIPKLPDEWKRLLPPELETTPIIWFSGDLRAKGAYLHSSKKVLVIDSAFLDKERLYHLEVEVVDKELNWDVNWWVYAGSIPPEAIGAER